MKGNAMDRNADIHGNAYLRTKGDGGVLSRPLAVAVILITPPLDPLETQFFFDGIIDVPDWPLVGIHHRDGEHTLHTWSLDDAMVIRAIADVVCCDANVVEPTPLLTKLVWQKIPNRVHQVGHPLLSIVVASPVLEAINSWHFMYQAVSNCNGLDRLRMKAQ